MTSQNVPSVEWGRWVFDEPNMRWVWVRYLPEVDYVEAS